MAKRNYHSASSINTANYCMMRYYLRYFDPRKPKPLRISPYAKGSLLHQIIERFWNHLGTPEEVEADKKSRKKAVEKKKYHDAESFGDYSQRKWTQIMIGNKRAKDPSKKIYWRDGYDNESEGWEIRAGIPKITAALFGELLKEGPPLYSELPFYFEGEGLKFKGFIDEVRIKNGNVLIRDYKSGSPFGIKEMKKMFDPQLTFYNAGLCSLIIGKDKKSEEFAKSLGLEEFREKLLEDPSYINPDFDEEFYMVEAPFLIELANAPSPKSPKLEDFAIIENYIQEYGDYRENLGVWKQKKSRFRTMPNINITTKRTEQDFYHLVDNIKTTERSIEQGNISFEHGQKCDNCDMRHACSKRSCEPIQETADKKGNLLFSFMDPPYTSQKPKKEKPKPPAQRKFDYRRKKPWMGRD